jgi:hypothetical protein
MASLISRAVHSGQTLALDGLWDVFDLVYVRIYPWAKVKWTADSGYLTVYQRSPVTQLIDERRSL